MNPQILLSALKAAGITRSVGVPDSTLQPFFDHLSGDAGFETLIATNECEATAIALGHYLATGAPSLVFLQNSGLGKTVHPITSLLSAEIFRAPALFLVGWRGCPDRDASGKLVHADEPQHKTMGRLMPELLRLLEVPFDILEDDAAQAQAAVARAVTHLRERKTPYALIVKPGLLGQGKGLEPRNGFAIRRSEAIERIVDRLPADTAIVTTTGKASRELYAIRERRGQGHERDFYTVGGMGCASAIGLGLASAQPRRRVCVIDGDGAALMHLGNLATIGLKRPAGLLHVLIDNRAHESTGGQPTASGSADLCAVARACGYPWVASVERIEELDARVDEALATRALAMIVVRAALGSDPALGRPTQTPRENAEGLMRFLGTAVRVEAK